MPRGSRAAPHYVRENFSRASGTPRIGHCAFPPVNWQPIFEGSAETDRPPPIKMSTERGNLLPAGTDLDGGAFGESAVEHFDNAVAYDAFEFLVRGDDSRC
jgi:hypothetical protein